MNKSIKPIVYCKRDFILHSVLQLLVALLGHRGTPQATNCESIMKLEIIKEPIGVHIQKNRHQQFRIKCKTKERKKERKKGRKTERKTERKKERKKKKDVIPRL